MGRSFADLRGVAAVVGRDHHRLGLGTIPLHINLLGPGDYSVEGQINAIGWDQLLCPGRCDVSDSQVPVN